MTTSFITTLAALLLLLSTASTATAQTSPTCFASSAAQPVAFPVDATTGTCAPGFYCPNTTKGVDKYLFICPPTPRCLEQRNNEWSYCEAQGSHDVALCPGGWYCPTGGQSKIACGAGEFCPPGSTAPIRCSALSYCPPLAKREVFYGQLLALGLIFLILLPAVGWWARTYVAPPPSEELISEQQQQQQNDNAAQLASSPQISGSPFAASPNASAMFGAGSGGVSSASAIFAADEKVQQSMKIVAETIDRRRAAFSPSSPASSSEDQQQQQRRDVSIKFTNLTVDVEVESDQDDDQKQHQQNGDDNEMISTNDSFTDTTSGSGSGTETEDDSSPTATQVAPSASPGTTEKKILNRKQQREVLRRYRELAAARQQQQRRPSTAASESKSSSTTTKLKRLLQPCSGEIRAARCTAILGGSGAAKTVLLKRLLQQPDANFITGGDVHFTGMHDDEYSRRRAVALVPQVDTVHDCTVWQNLWFSSEVRARSAFDDDTPEATTIAMDRFRLAVLDILQMLPFRERVSSQLSGGQRRRLSIAVELVSAPCVLFGDEVTTGLDAAVASRIVGMLATCAAQTRIPVVLVLHQPRVEIWEAIDDVVLMAPGGNLAYAGPRADALGYFQKLGVVSSSGGGGFVSSNPADLILDAIAEHSDVVVDAWKKHVEEEKSNNNNNNKEKGEQQKQQQKEGEESSAPVVATNPLASTAAAAAAAAAARPLFVVEKKKDDDNDQEDDSVQVEDVDAEGSGDAAAAEDKKTRPPSAAPSAASTSHEPDFDPAGDSQQQQEQEQKQATAMVTPAAAAAAAASPASAASSNNSPSSSSTITSVSLAREISLMAQRRVLKYAVDWKTVVVDVVVTTIVSAIVSASVAGKGPWGSSLQGEYVLMSVKFQIEKTYMVAMLLIIGLAASLGPTAVRLGLELPQLQREFRGGHRVSAVFVGFVFVELFRVTILALVFSTVAYYVWLPTMSFASMFAFTVSSAYILHLLGTLVGLMVPPQIARLVSLVTCVVWSLLNGFPDMKGLYYVAAVFYSTILLMDAELSRFRHVYDYSATSAFFDAYDSDIEAWVPAAAAVVAVQTLILLGLCFLMLWWRSVE